MKWREKKTKTKTQNQLRAYSFWTNTKWCRKYSLLGIKYFDRFVFYMFAFNFSRLVLLFVYCTLSGNICYARTVCCVICAKSICSHTRFALQISLIKWITCLSDQTKPTRFIFNINMSRYFSCLTQSSYDCWWVYDWCLLLYFALLCESIGCLFAACCNCLLSTLLFYCVCVFFCFSSLFVWVNELFFVHVSGLCIFTI